MKSDRFRPKSVWPKEVRNIIAFFGNRGAQMEPADMPIAELVNMESAADVFEEVKIIVSLMFPKLDFAALDFVFKDIVRLFNGKYPGYRACNTRYHDLKHTTDAFLAMARLIHGASIDGIKFNERQIKLGLISALMHDTGYIQTLDDRTGTGGKYTLTHIRRSMDFMDGYFVKKAYSREDFQLCSKCLSCTGLDTRVNEILFDTPEDAILGKMLGTADLFGQLADRSYLKKLTFLYHEFREANVPGYEDELDLFEKTPTFYEFTLKRIERELGNVNRYLQHHFKARWNIDRDLYQDAIERNINYLKQVIESNRLSYQDRKLMSSVVVAKLMETYVLGLPKPYKMLFR